MKKSSNINIKNKKKKNLESIEAYKNYNFNDKEV